MSALRYSSPDGKAIPRLGLLDEHGPRRQQRIAWLGARTFTPQYRTWIWPYGLLGLLLAIVFWPAWVSHDLLISGGDVLLHFYPVQFFFRQAVAAGEFPFWNPYTFSGVPAFANLQQGYSYPVHWAFLWMPPILGVNWLIGVHVVLAGLTSAWCAGRLGASREGQFLSGVAYALGSAMISRIWAGREGKINERIAGTAS